MMVWYYESQTKNIRNSSERKDKGRVNKHINSNVLSPTQKQPTSKKKKGNDDNDVYAQCDAFPDIPTHSSSSHSYPNLSLAFQSLPLNGKELGEGEWSLS